MVDKTRKEYRRRVRCIYKWWQDKYPEYFEAGTRALDDEEKNDAAKFHFKNDRDIIYTGLNAKAVLAYLSEKKKKRLVDGKVTLVSVSELKKYDDAIKWGSKIAEQPLPSDYYRKIETFIQA